MSNKSSVQGIVETNENNEIDLVIEYLIKRNNMNDNEALNFADDFRKKIIEVDNLKKMTVKFTILEKDDCLMEYIFDKKQKIAITQFKDFFRVKGTNANEKIQSILQLVTITTKHCMEYDNKKYECNYNFRIENKNIVAESIINYKDKFDAKLFVERGNELIDAIQRAILAMYQLNVGYYTPKDSSEKNVNYTRSVRSERDFWEANWNMQRYFEAKLNKNLGKSNKYEDMLTDSVDYKIIGNYEKAKELCFEAIRKNKDMCTAYYNLGKLLYIIGDYDASIRSYKKAIDRNLPTGNNILIHIGHSLMDKNEENQKKYKKSIETYKRRIDPYSFIKEGLDANDVGMIAESNAVYSKYEKMCVDRAKKEFNL